MNISEPEEAEVTDISRDIQQENEQSTSFDANNIGRRIVDMSYFIKSIMTLNKHEPFQCGFGDMQIVGEQNVQSQYRSAYR